MGRRIIGPNGCNPLHETRRSFQKAILVSDHIQVCANLQQFPRQQEEVWPSRASDRFIAQRKGFIQQYATGRQTLQYGLDQRPPQIIGNDYGTKSSRLAIYHERPFVAFDVRAYQFSTRHTMARLIDIPVNTRHGVAALGKPLQVPA
jgi:hypothetical protein